MTYNVYVSSESPRASGHNAKLGDLLVRTAETKDMPIQIVTRSTQAPRSDDAASIYEEVDDIGFTFARFNHTGGEGLAWYPPRSGKIVPELDPIRFYDSKNLAIGREVEDVPYRVELARSYELQDTSQTFVDVFASNSAIYTAYSLSIKEHTDWDDVSPTTHTLTGTTGPILCIFGSRADDVCVITTEGDMFVKPKGATAFALCYEAGVTGEALTAGWWAKGRVMAQRGKASTIATAELLEINFAVGGTAGSPTVTPTVDVIDTFDATVNCVVDASVAIVAALSNGELRSYVPQSDTAGTDPSLTIRGTTPMPTAEEPYNIGFGSGKLIVLTTNKTGTGHVHAYSANVLDSRYDYVVGNIQLLRDWKNASDEPDIRHNMVSTRNAIWWLVSLDSGQCELWTYDVITTGVFHWVEIGAGIGLSLVSSQDVFGLLLGDEVWNRGDGYKDSGYLITPNINFGRTGDMAWVQASVFADQLSAAYGTIALYRSTDPDAIYDANHVSWQLVGKLNDTSQSGNEMSLNGLVSSQIALKLVVEGPTAQNNTPRLLRYNIRGIPAARDWEITIPINISDLIEVPYRQPYLLPGWGEALYQAISSFEGQNMRLTLYNPESEFEGIINGVSVPIDYRPDRGSATRYCMVQLRGSKVTGSELFTGSNSWAQQPYALALYGTGESENELV